MVQWLGAKDQSLKGPGSTLHSKALGSQNLSCAMNSTQEPVLIQPADASRNRSLRQAKVRRGRVVGLAWQAKELETKTQPFRTNTETPNVHSYGDFGQRAWMLLNGSHGENDSSERRLAHEEC